ncbi:group I truncated hemoglobin [Fluviispira multicolorata]|uniref:Group 1 truncated hemoglobin n=1 Tax=Fluviispira multicolorata TaxID=2654512 RepID=A0A833N5M5_9BACT|nr:group 1 truncated hemoglobin [Fluviispira multicolorata]KAB8030922.1 hypothetical protein GCL57_08090 [Fluviispira multicolorata]
MKKNIYDKYGGSKALEAIVIVFYEKVLQSKNLIHYFENIDMNKLMSHQVKFLSALLGGPIQYDNSTIKNMHRKLNISEKDFNETANLLKETLAEKKFDWEDIDSVMKKISSFKDDIVTKSPHA